ncbi:MAG: TAT-variant-translocated molybdopterin oxidoreductase [Pirellulaceae bacterium]
MQAKLPITTAESQPTLSVPGHAAQAVQSVTRASGYWRSVGELEGTPEFEQMLHREFPQAASEFPEGVSRRRWMKLMSASLALGGLAGCSYGPDSIAPMVVRPPNTIPGVPKHYATNFQLAGRAVHLLVSNLDGRPIKIEGNAAHPVMRATEPNDINDKPRFASAGTDVFSQACILGLYDPDRSSRVAKRVDGSLVDSSWEEFADYAQGHANALAESQGSRLAILMAPSLSPSINRMVAETVKLLPKTTVAHFASIDDSAQQTALAEAAGKPAEVLYDLSSAKVICCLDSDLLGNDPNMLVYSRQFARGRTPEPGKMNRLYAVEARHSVTGSSADSRLAVRSSQIGAFLVRLEKAVDELLAGGSPAVAADGELPLDKVDAAERLERFVSAMAEDLVQNRGAGLVAVGAHQPHDVQLAALRLNNKLENIGKTLNLRPRRSAIAGVETVGLAELVEKLANGVDTVWILGDNPVYSAPGDVKLGETLAKLDHVVYLAEYEDETAKTASWSVPLAHALESWGDVLGVDGSYGVCQPQILPLLNGKDALEILSLLHGKPETGAAIVRATADSLGQQLTERKWRDVLHDGYLASNTADSITADIAGDGPLPTGVLNAEIKKGELELLFVESDTIYDGRFAKNVWLQELPQAITKIVWDNAALISFATAEATGMKQGEIVRLSHGEKTLDLPVSIVPGQADGTIVVHIGYGRVCRDEAVDSNDTVEIGKSVSPMRSIKNMHILTGVEAQPTSRPYKLVSTQDHFAIDDQVGGIDQTGLDGIKERVGGLVREGTLKQISEMGAKYVEGLGIHHPPLKSLWDEPIDAEETKSTVPYQWAMTIDLNKCTGCNSCVIACQAENNVPVVGKEQVGRGREMHWIRVDRYFRGEQDTPQIVNQPVACVHCETAPCEQVCPVAATVHTEEGINAMAYNRCVGTRYCANNCPYKVRRFNYFNYGTEYGYFYGWQQKSKLDAASRQLQQLVLNPDVSVRGRGVMEKCTYCIQRVQNGKINARNEARLVEDGEVQSACQTACPTQAIVFGDIKDQSSLVYQLQHSPRAYAMLEELNIKPRTQYLIRVRNTHPRLLLSVQIGKPAHGGHGEHDAHDAAHDEAHPHADEQAHAEGDEHATTKADH